MLLWFKMEEVILKIPKYGKKIAFFDVFAIFSVDSSVGFLV